MKKRYLSIVGLVGIAGASTVIMSSPALAGASQPFFVFKDPATQTGAGSRDLTVCWKDAKGVAHTRTVSVPIGPGAKPAATAKAAIVILNTDPVIGADWKFAYSHPFGSGVDIASAVPTAAGAGSVSTSTSEGDTPSTATTPLVPVTGMTVSAGRDPATASAFFNVFGTVSGVGRGIIELGIEGVTVSTDTFVTTLSGTVDKSISEIKSDLVQDFLTDGFAGSFINPISGLIDVPSVTSGDPFGTNGVDIGASFLSTDSDLGGFSGCGSGACVPEPSTWTMMLLGFAGLGFLGSRARRLARGVG